MIPIILQTLLPVFLLIAAGVGLRQIGFLDDVMEGALNAFCYWIALPVFIVVKIAGAPGLESSTFDGILALLLVTLSLAAAGWGVARLLRIPSRSTGTFVQAAFRGNLAYVGLPVIAFALSNAEPAVQARAESFAILTMTPLVLFYNILAVMVLEWDRRHDRDSHPFRDWIRSAVRNPLIIACLLGLIWNLLHFPVPELLLDTTLPVARTAFPLALMAIGARIRRLSWKGAGRGMLGVCLVKNGLSLLIGIGVCHLFGLEPIPRLVVLVLSATPSAIAAYVLVDQLDGDRDLAASAIAATTLCSFLSLAGAVGIGLS